MNDKIISFIRELYGEAEAPIPLHAPTFTQREKDYLADCIDSTFVSSVGAYVGRFEEQIRQHTGAAAAIAVVNGTCALTAALVLAGVKRDDLVLTQGLTFVATANAIVHAGAVPAFLDSDAQTLGMSHEALARFLDEQAVMRSGEAIHRESGRRIGAVAPMHVFGHACRIDAIAEICRKWNIPLVEDAAEALGSTYKDQALGTWGRLGVLSFNGNKTITTGGGGMILTRDAALGERVRHRVSTAKRPHPWEYFHDEVAWNFRMPNINAALGCAQMERLDEFLERKRAIAAAYAAFFNDFDEANFVSEPPDCRSNYWLCAVLFRDREQRDDFLRYSNEHGVMTRPAWTLMPDLPMYAASITDGLPTARNLTARLVNLPSGVAA